jgi:hypothetical protein
MCEAAVPRSCGPPETLWLAPLSGEVAIDEVRAVPQAPTETGLELLKEREPALTFQLVKGAPRELEPLADLRHGIAARRRHSAPP